MALPRRPAGPPLTGAAGRAVPVRLVARDARELTKALALYGAAAPAGGTAGVFPGGVLTEGADSGRALPRQLSLRPGGPALRRRPRLLPGRRAARVPRLALGLPGQHPDRANRPRPQHPPPADLGRTP